MSAVEPGLPLLIRASGRDRPSLTRELLQLLGRAGAVLEDMEQLVVREREPEHRRTVVRQVVLVERDDGAAGPVVEQLILVEDRDLAVLEGLEEVLPQLPHRSPGVGRAGQARDEVQPARDLGEVALDLEQVFRIQHASSLNGGPGPPAGSAEPSANSA